MMKPVYNWWLQACFFASLTTSIASAAPPAMRVWKDATGTHSVEAVLVSHSKDAVELRTKAGLTVKVPLSKLSAVDRKYLAQLPADPGAVAKTQMQDVYLAVQSPVDLPAFKGSLHEALDKIGSLAGVQFFINHDSLDTIGVSRDAPVVVEPKREQLGAALTKILEEHDLHWTVWLGVIYIHGNDDIEQRFGTRVYRGNVRDWDPIVDALQEKIEPESWVELGGPASLAVIHPSFLAVRHREQTHHAIHTMFARQLRPIAGKRVTPGDLKIKSGALMSKHVDAEFVDTPLTDAATVLSKRAGVPIEIDKTALFEVGYTPDAVVNVRLRDLPLMDVLSLILDPMDLAWSMKDGKAIITTVDAAEDMLVEFMHPAQDLLRGGASPNSYLEAIQITISPSSWAEVGGNGSLRFDARGGLVVRNTLATQLLVAQFLADFRGK